jgi:hypothetical protein
MKERKKERKKEKVLWFSQFYWISFFGKKKDVRINFISFSKQFSFQQICLFEERITAYCGCSLIGSRIIVSTGLWNQIYHNLQVPNYSVIPIVD